MFSFFFFPLLFQYFFFFFFNDTATTEIYTLSLHDALPIYLAMRELRRILIASLLLGLVSMFPSASAQQLAKRSEEHTSELQSQSNLVCRLLLEKKKKKTKKITNLKHIEY